MIKGKTNSEGVKAAIARAFDDYAAPTRCYYDRAPTNAPFPYAVIRNLQITTLSEGDSAVFDLELHGDETDENAAADMLEGLCDAYRSRAEGSIITDGETFSGHVNFESERQGGADAEFDLMRRTLSFTLRFFYYHQRRR